MNEKEKKRVLIIMMTCCLVLTVGITLFTSGVFRRRSAFRMSDTVSLFCVNPACGAESDISRQAYIEDVESSGMMAGPMTMMVMVECPECGEKSAARGLRCKECKRVFMQQFGGEDYSDRCPHCGHSEIAVKRGEE